VQVVAGRHFSDYWTLQGDYVWKSNELSVTSGTLNGAQEGYQETRSSSQQSVLAGLLVYFRKRDSRLRPYTVGRDRPRAFREFAGADPAGFWKPVLPPSHFTSNMIALHVPVGIDVRLSNAGPLSARSARL
jgi:hypothetical protein